MPEQMSTGPEREFHEEERRSEIEQYEKSWDKLQAILEAYSGDPGRIPSEELEDYIRAAEHYLEVANNPAKPNVDAKIKNLAELVLQEKPKTEEDSQENVESAA